MKRHGNEKPLRHGSPFNQWFLHEFFGPQAQQKLHPWDSKIFKIDYEKVLNQSYMYIIIFYVHYNTVTCRRTFVTKCSQQLSASSSASMWWKQRKLNVEALYSTMLQNGKPLQLKTQHSTFHQTRNEHFGCLQCRRDQVLSSFNLNGNLFPIT